MINGSGDAEITATNGGGDVDSEVQVLHGNGRAETFSNEGNDILGGTEVGEESSEENIEIQAPKSRRRQVTQEDKERLMELTIADAHSQVLAAYDGLKIRKSYPKAYAKLSEYMAVKAHLPGMMDDETILGILLYSPRIVLFDFFDTNKVYVNVLGGETSWWYKVNGQLEDSGFKGRLEAETTGFYKAFEILEKLLNT